MLEIFIKYFNPNLKKIEKFQIGDWIDLRSSELINISKDEFKLIPLGVAMQLPPGYEAHIVPRSSTYKNFGIIQTNSMGIIDNSYRGDNDQWYFPAYCLREFTIIQENDRICQFRIMKSQPGITFHEKKYFDSEDRGGFGSSGIK